MENKFREYWVYSNEEYAPTYACDFNQRGFVPSRNRESIHTIEIAAVEQLKAEIKQLKEYNDNCISRTLHDARVEQLESDLRTSDLNRQSLWVDSLKLVDENAALKSKLKISTDALRSISNVVGTSTLQYQMAQKTLSEIEG